MMDSPGGPLSRLELMVKCKNLKDKDTFSKSDPICAVFIHGPTGWNEIGRTEIIKDCLDPVFTRSIQVDYYFEAVQRIRFAVYDADNESADLSDDDYIGQLLCTVGEIAGAPNAKLIKPLYKGEKERGVITVTAEEVRGSAGQVEIQFGAQNLAKKDFFGKSDPFLEISRMLPSGEMRLLHKTEVISNNLDPTWKPFMLSQQQLCGGDPNSALHFQISDWDAHSASDPIGHYEVPISSLSGTNNPRFRLLHPKGKDKDVGYLVVLRYKPKRTFLEYLSMGYRLRFIVGVDLTASNGDPRRTDSLHFMAPNHWNEYQLAIQAVGTIVACYDPQQLFAAFGFGCKLPDGRVSFAQPLTGQPENPYCQGVNGVLQAYALTLANCKLFGPTNFQPIIAAARSMARQNWEQSKLYSTLLMMTDGEITDMESTIDEIVYASKEPLSIIIVGVGNESFKAMQRLDGDDGVLRSSKGQPCVRDIVQFVPFRKHANDPQGLAAEVLKELPTQYCNFLDQYAHN
eukprot:Rmarinus@m.8941